LPTQFTHTTRSLANDRSVYTLVAWLLGTVLLGAWLAWFLLGEVALTETSRKARLEVRQLPHHVGALFSGRVAATTLAIGQEVAANDVLVELDAGPERLRLAEEEARLAALPPRMAALRAELVALEQARADDQRATQAAIEAGRARIQETEAAVRFAKNNEARLKEQSSAGGIAQIEALRALAETQKLAAAKDAMLADLRRLELDRVTRAHQSQAQMEKLNGTLAQLEGEMGTAHATIARLREEIDRHVVRAPVAGRVGDAVPLHAGAYVTQGQRLASIVPPGALVIVADFAPASAMGRVRPGQPGRMRLDGFPWAQFGSIEATVGRVATEIRDNLVRVEFVPSDPAIGGGNAVAGMMQHGLPGSIEVTIERASPALLVLRAAGLLLSGQGRQQVAATAAPAGSAAR